MARFRRFHFRGFRNRFRRRVKRFVKNSRRGFIRKVNRGGVRL